MSHSDWETVIGLEIHAQIISKSKLFSGSSAEFGSDPNENFSYIDGAFPGMLPVANLVCIHQAIKTGLGFNGKISKESVFDRKNYFYPDLPAGYQISQFRKPIVEGGSLLIELKDYTKRINITRLHIEQDAGKSSHDVRESYIDLNRAGVGLMEIVSEPEMSSSEEAMAYVKAMRALVRYLNTCDGNMEEGSMRADANVSIRKRGDPLGTRCEIKNINSIRFLGQAIDYEVGRQISLIESGGKVVQETRLFDSKKCETRPMRSKEEAADYRYFPDPDLPPLVVSQELIDSIRNSMPELPEQKMQRYVSLGLNGYEASVITQEKEVASFFDAILTKLSNVNKEVPIKLVVNWFLGDFFALINKLNCEINSSPISVDNFCNLMILIHTNVISGKIAKDVLEFMQNGDNPIDIVEKKGLKQILDTGFIEDAIKKILESEQEKVAEYKNGKDKLFGYFVGLVMKELKGKGNPAIVNDTLKENLSSSRTKRS
jgi:aspartyl-tRNA(Asn)/glutamyl-tRNA(Gln) amidotransferase subunit B